MTDEKTVLTESTPLDLRLSEAELEATRDHVVEFIRGVVDDAGADGAVLGLSGGIDSTLTAYLAADALGPEDLHGLIMPSEVNRAEDASDAERVAQELGIAYDVVEIRSIVDRITSAFPEARDDKLATGNVRVRARGVLNYYVANHENAIVLGTGNRTEALTGYFTKYGDQAVDCNPIGNLYKQQVRQLAAHVGVPDDLVMRTPTAGMWTGQTDEEELGLSYDHIDAILALHVDGPLSTAATVRHLDDVTEAQVERVEELYEQSKHKRAMPPAPEPLDL
jgi:NAD+ synthase